MPPVHPRPGTSWSCGGGRGRAGYGSKGHRAFTGFMGFTGCVPAVKPPPTATSNRALRCRSTASGSVSRAPGPRRSRPRCPGGSSPSEAAKPASGAARDPDAASTPVGHVARRTGLRNPHERAPHGPKLTASGPKNRGPCTEKDPPGTEKGRRLTLFLVRRARVLVRGAGFLVPPGRILGPGLSSVPGVGHPRPQAAAALAGNPLYSGPAPRAARKPCGLIAIHLFLNSAWWRVCLMRVSRCDAPQSQNARPGWGAKSRAAAPAKKNDLIPGAVQAGSSH
jgi:hypothetical protein